MTDHWDGFDHHDDLPDVSDGHDTHDPLVSEFHEPDLPDLHEPDLQDPDLHEPGWHEPDAHDAELGDHVADVDTHDDISEMSDSFPPALEVGDLPEPVDGFPWVDAATLGTPDAYQPSLDAVDPMQLAEHAGIEVPDGADPWATLAASEDPAVSALARWWTPDER